MSMRLKFYFTLLCVSFETLKEKSRGIFILYTMSSNGSAPLTLSKMSPIVVGAYAYAYEVF